MFYKVTAPGGLKLREAPGTRGRVLGILSHASILQVRIRSGSWMMVDQTEGGPSGWVSADYVEPSGAPTAMLLPQDGAREVVVAPGLSVRVSVRPEHGLRKLALEFALAFEQGRVGEEGGENRGAWVSEFLRRTGIHTPAPWCAAFVNTCAELAGEALGYHSPLEQIPLQAYVQSSFQWAQKHDLLVSPAEALPGDMILFFDTKLKRFAHVGLVRRVEGDRVLTVEGNTSPGTGETVEREGDVVACKNRKITTRMAFVRWTRKHVVKRVEG